MRAQKTGQPSKAFEAMSPDDRSFEPQENIDTQDISQDERKIRTTAHEHNGLDAPPVNLSDLIGLIEVVSSVPTKIPKAIFDQVKLYSNGGTRRVYFYVTDSAGSGAWRYAALT